MATSFGNKTPIVLQTDGSPGQEIICDSSTPNTVPPSALGSRTILKDSYRFISGTRAEFQAVFSDSDKPVSVDVGSTPRADIFADDVLIASLQGELSTGQLYEYSFFWDVPGDQDTRRVFRIQYRGHLSQVEYVWGHEFFKVTNSPSNIKLKTPTYATVDQLRLSKPNIDSYLPVSLRGNKPQRDIILQEFLSVSTKELNGQLNLRDFHYSFNDNFNLYTRYHAIWSIMGSQMGEDGSSVSDKSLAFWEKKWTGVLKQIKMHSQLSNIPTGRA